MDIKRLVKVEAIAVGIMAAGIAAKIIPDLISYWPDVRGAEDIVALRCWRWRR